ncbi:hypothetical protein QBC33DRAFT_543305 [Phialemonium atrogriseum]|uniref:Clr5 domain-containing protein n=1 Tax=Phialemonium atrogriseum TaxID=1093897 RepID=A0AAJ0FEH8_9PEZI|nr:uncharacterized protein QBC33DRAFT_543305 [Phialemonium atrogriseum]KAK1765596.1 hypothetical protein QBC33DRAFT_543305 [Phialemonium atrogriseum]
MASAQPHGRRAYKRIGSHIWNEHKEVIRELFLDQEKTHEQVSVILADRYSLDVGLRQLKRKTDGWGFFKNIPSAEMKKMARIRARRQDQLGRETKFIRGNGDGSPREVPQEKLDAYQKRFGCSMDLMSQSSGTPPNIVYQTPSNGNQTPSVGNRGQAPSYAERVPVFNESVNRAFINFGSAELDSLSSSQPSRITTTPLTWPAISRLEDSAAEDALDGDYTEASQKFKLLSQLPCYSHSVAVSLEFVTLIMEAANYAGCPQSLVARITTLISHFLMRERERYANDHSKGGDVTELDKTLAALKIDARYYGRLVVHQRVLRIWEPILGLGHPKIRKLSAQISAFRHANVVDLEIDPKLGEEFSSWTDILKPDEIPRLRGASGLRNLMHLEDGPPDQLREKLRVLESSDITSSEAKREMELLQHGRYQALLGVYHSLLGNFEDAENAFQESIVHIGYEVCVEVKLHRLLWYAEHKTRVQDWDGVWGLLGQAHAAFMRNERPSDFIIYHVPGRFESLCKAISKRVPIDRVAADDSQIPRAGSLPAPTPGAIPLAAPSQAASPIISLQRLFPSTPGSANFAVDIDAWAEFVQFSPVALAATPAVTGSITQED